MGVVYDILHGIPLPRMVKVRQKFDRTHIERDAIPSVIRDEFRQAKIDSRFRPGMEVAITCGSRGIANMDMIIRSIAEELRVRGCRPFVVPAMGSHGGATAEGQERVCLDYNVTPEFTGCEIRSSMETVCIGTTADGRPVNFDKNAFCADGIVVVNRIKAHTDFRGPYESGLMKMLAIGLGKQYGAAITHMNGFGEMAENIPAFGTAMIRLAPVTMGLAILDNAYDQTMELHALTPEEIITEEPKLLEHSKNFLPRILWDECDVLIMDLMGKNISGAGMDPNVDGRFQTPYADGGIRAKREAVLDLTPESHGNFCGIGVVDVTTRRLFEKMDFDATYPNCITNTVVEGMRIPLVLDSDKLVFQCCVRTATGIDKEHPRIIRIKSTLDVEEIEISEAMLAEAKANPQIEILSEPYEIPFNANGDLF